jgi:hypothetical protein
VRSDLPPARARPAPQLMAQLLRGEISIRRDCEHCSLNHHLRLLLEPMQPSHLVLIVVVRDSVVVQLLEVVAGAAHRIEALLQVQDLNLGIDLARRLLRWPLHEGPRHAREGGSQEGCSFSREGGREWCRPPMTCHPLTLFPVL